MLVKDLPEDTELKYIKVRIPDTYKHEARMCGLNTMEVYIHSSWFSGIWVKADSRSERVYPLNIMPSGVLNWEVIK